MSSIPSGGETQLQIEMSAKADLVQKPYAIDMTMKYEDSDCNPYENVTSLSVPVKQLSRVEYSTAEVVPESITPGGQANVVFSIYNTGKTTLYNVKVRFEDESVSGGDCYVGKLESGATGNVDSMITGEMPTTGDGTVKTIISYENDAGEVTEVETLIPLLVEEEMMMDNMDYIPEEIPEEGGGGLSLGWKIGALGIIALIVAVIVVVNVRKKQKIKRELAEDLEDLKRDIQDKEE